MDGSSVARLYCSCSMYRDVQDHLGMHGSFGTFAGVRSRDAAWPSANIRMVLRSEGMRTPHCTRTTPSSSTELPQS